ncbi:hypothetical protein A4V04_02840 [Burkholderiales bacterium YL45]|uniref:Uncharacterized protein n=1 Tax=Turicimonas muris TaxID=1796652 RepID=A0A227KS08_9BURK|nr:hypothetical protein A4V04_02840 [Burkholderiales bacterium YL45]OXE51292.1 hypothetical protein ADH67_03080 [Turicimonas muris]
MGTLRYNKADPLNKKKEVSADQDLQKSIYRSTDTLGAKLEEGGKNKCSLTFLLSCHPKRVKRINQ